MKASTRAALTLALVALLLFGVAAWLGIPTTPHGKTVVTVRVWDQQVAEAYRGSFDEFSRRNPDIQVAVTVTSYASYFNSLRTDVAGHGADDIFWLSNAYLSDYADTGNLVPVEPRADWDPSVVAQFTRDGKLWGCRSSATRELRCTTTRTCSTRPRSTRQSWPNYAGTPTPRSTPCAPCCTG